MKTTTKTETPVVSATYTAALATARSLIKKDYGACTIIRAITQKYPKLVRHEVMEIAELCKLNAFTASRQYHLVRSGEVEIEMAAL